MEIVKKGRWQVCFTCKHCETVVDLVDVDNGTCPNCEMMATDNKTIAVISKRRFLYHHIYPWYYWWKQPFGIWEYSIDKRF